jgi:outer membrane protein assembly factor BamD
VIPLRHPVTPILFSLALLLAACAPAFRLQRYTTNEELFAAAARERAAGREDNAIAAYERLQVQLAPNDTLLLRVYRSLGELHLEKKQWLLAGQAYLRIPEYFPDADFADDALLAAGNAYARLWRSPELDAKYGLEALATYNLLIGQYPASPLLTEAGAGAAKLREMLAQKELGIGQHYFRRKAYDSAIIYFSDAAAAYPGTDGARDALLMMVRAYRILKYEEDAQETCDRARSEYKDDAAVLALCPVPPRA